MSRTSIKTMERNSIKYMLKHVEGYEKVKKKEHEEFKTAREYFRAKEICYQNFYKFYARYVANDRDVTKLLPVKRGPKPKYSARSLLCEGELEDLVIKYRKIGLNKFEIAECLKKKHNIKRSGSASTVYRICKAHGLSRLTQLMKEEKRKIVKERAGELIHVDCHYLPKGIVKEHPSTRYYVLGGMDDYSRVVWVEAMKSVKSLDATFAMMDVMLVLNKRYGIQTESIITDNGSEFCSPDKENHPFERLLEHFAVKHRRTKPYRPQTNGKIERFWKTFDEDVIEGSEFNTFEDLKEAVLGYNLYYNELRPHQGINGAKPIEMLNLIRENN